MMEGSGSEPQEAQKLTGTVRSGSGSLALTLAISLFLILPASSIFFPLIHSLARLLLAEQKYYW
jgi:hypothetical protein